MGNVLDLYRTQIDVLWNWSGGRVALVKRLLITLVVATIAFAATAWLLRSVTVDSVWAASRRFWPIAMTDTRPVNRHSAVTSARK